MNQITLHVSEENTNLVLSILENLKDGLISKIDHSVSSNKSPKYKPRQNAIIDEKQKPKGKYISRTEYKKRINNI
jgi:hypothetical protein